MSKVYRLQYSPDSKQDLDDIFSYLLDKFAPDAAINLVFEIETRVKHLKEFPYSHPLWSFASDFPRETRHFPVIPYRVFYHVIEPVQIVEILRVLHERVDTKNTN